MSQAARIRGSELTLLVTVNGELQDQITDISSFETEEMLEIISKGYLGHPTDLVDTIFSGTKFSMKLHMHSAQAFVLKKAIKDKAKRIAPANVFNISGTFAFPSGETVSALLSDVSFGPWKQTTSSRKDYVEVDLQGQCSDSNETIT